LLLIVPQGSADTQKLTKKLKYVRVEVLHLQSKSSTTKKPRVKTIWGLARPGEGQKEPHPPKVDRLGAGPKGVKFWLNAAGPDPAATSKPGKKGQAKKQGGALPENDYVTVFDYFQNSEYLSHSC